MFELGGDGAILRFVDGWVDEVLRDGEVIATSASVDCSNAPTDVALAEFGLSAEIS